MSFELEVTPASEVSHLRAGFAFIIRGRTGAGVCEGRIKPSGRVAIEHGTYPSAAVRDAMKRIAARYAEGEDPTDRTFASAEGAEPDED